MSTLDLTLGCLLGLSLGDAFGASFEGGVIERSVWRVIGTTRNGRKRWTDDTQMTFDIVESYLARGAIEPDDLADRFARSYRWSRGYGPGAAKVLRRIARGQDWRTANRSVHPQGSFGNGAAMRSPVIGLIFSNRPEAMAKAVADSAIVTHAHPLAIEGASIVALATAAAYRGGSADEILEASHRCISDERFRTRFDNARHWFESKQEPAPREVARILGRGIAAHESCVTAVYLALKFLDRDFESLHRFVVSCGGDTDTIGAMAGAVWGAANGIDRLPSEWLDILENRETLIESARKLHSMIVQPPNMQACMEPGRPTS